MLRDMVPLLMEDNPDDDVVIICQTGGLGLTDNTVTGRMTGRGRVDKEDGLPPFTRGGGSSGGEEGENDSPSPAAVLDLCPSSHSCTPVSRLSLPGVCSIRECRPH